MRMRSGGEEVALLTFRLRPLRLPPSFSHAERAIAQALLDGLSNAEIAAARRTSERTVANQIASVFRKLGVHSRPEFVVRIARGGKR
jgi:DNA-binding NarL/FixJ family response regulator